MNAALAIVAFVVALIGAILIHELGHLLAAKRVGMKADRYFVGFGPTLWSTRRGETEFGVKALPLGGFVSIRGMTPLDERRAPLVDAVFAATVLRADEDAGGEVAVLGDGTVVTEASLERLRTELTERGTPEPVVRRLLERVREQVAAASGLPELRAAVDAAVVDEVGASAQTGDLAWRLLRGDEGRFYRDRAPWQRAVTIVMGPLTHLVIAFVVLVGLYALLALPTGEVSTEVAVVFEDTPAAAAGLEPGDRVVGVADVRSSEFEELRSELRARPGEPTSLTVERDGQRRSIELVPRAEPDPETGHEVGVAGFAPAPVEERLGPVAAVRRALVGAPHDPFGGVVPMLGASVQGLASIFSPSGLSDLVSSSVGAQERDPEGVVSVIGIASLAGQTAEAGSAGVYTFFFLLAYLNVFLFVFNMIPLPPFDGGHLAVLGVEKVGNVVRRLRGHPADFTVDPRAITAVALPVIGLLLLVVVASLWLDISDPIRL